MMAAIEDPPFSLLSLEDELTCSICLSPFDCPVTIPCGHNFCQDCLLTTWTDSYSCPQCRTLFATRPELKKNTVLSTVVETFRSRAGGPKEELSGAEEEKKKEMKVCCDTCMEAEAAQTCLTCMASFCEEHLRPHRENPTFRVHQLSEPVGDLTERICPDHHKLMELFCSQHGRPICSLCLQQVHRGCSFRSPEEQRSLLESGFRDKLALLNDKIEKTETAMSQLNEAQNNLKDAAAKRKAALSALYQQIQDMLALDEREAQHEVDCELEAGQTKLRDLMKRYTENNKKMRKAREDINSLLSRSHTSAFLQASFNLPKVVKSEPHVPRINLDSKKVTAAETFAAKLKENLTEIFKQPAETRLALTKEELNPRNVASGEKAAPASGTATKYPGSQPESELSKQKHRSRSQSPGRPPIRPVFQPVFIPSSSYMGPLMGWSQSQYPQFQSPGSPFLTAQMTKQDKKPPSAPGGNKPAGKDKPRNHPPSAQHPRPDL
ncbi:E3 ubiquitin/ISG15 ligase TRIM25-like [Acanthochromis polyacanthus]|uniref:E3 ubiquitin/ISG15 ligase TRIM25-like n=1 Tax=Acanthochromis polyacanthus TaxID=80966 RepID=UPI002234C435|nr:E3 ubiquitin/ISG15 ligase TRIM25-like [Acanthochromis polyacanthus]